MGPILSHVYVLPPWLDIEAVLPQGSYPPAGLSGVASPKTEIPRDVENYLFVRGLPTVAPNRATAYQIDNWLLKRYGVCRAN